MENNREKTVVKTSIISILANLVLTGFKVFIGTISNSIAIISDAVNNLSDALSSIVTIIGTKLAGKAPDKKHPYGYGRIEYLTAFIVSAIVLYAGITALTESVEKIIHPEESDYSVVTFVILIASVAVKFILGLYVKKKGKEIHSDALVASGTDAFNDGILTISVLASAFIYMLFHVNLEAYVGVVLSAFIIKTGIELIRESVDNMLGTRVESEISRKIKREIKKIPEVEGVFDLILHNYGPDKYLGSVHIEIPDTLSVTEVDKISRDITRKVMKKYGVILHTIGIYSVNTKDKKVIKIRDAVREKVFAHDGVLEMHGFYLDQEAKVMSFDIIIDFRKKNREEIYRAIYDEVVSLYPDYKLNITLDTDVSD